MAKRLALPARTSTARSVCLHCGRPVFTLRPIDSGERLYCSLACRYADQTLEEIAAELSAIPDLDDEEDDDDD